MGEGNTKTPTRLGPAVHLALRAPQPSEAHIFAETPFKKKTFSWLLTIVSKTPFEQARNKNAIETVILNHVLDRD